jgi:hypothetical protein
MEHEKAPYRVVDGLSLFRQLTGKRASLSTGIIVWIAMFCLPAQKKLHEVKG